MRAASFVTLCWVLVALAACGGGAAPTEPSPVPSSATAPPTSVVRLADDFDGRRLFPSDNWWNQEITNAPVDSRSDAFVNFVGPTRALHPDFGPPPYGIPYVGVGGAEVRSPITFVEYGDESDKGFGSETGYPVPDAAKTQPNYIEGGVPGGGSNGDRHLIVVDRDRWLLFETHGLIVADNGSDMSVSGAMDPRWNNDELNPAFRSLTAGDFEVVRLGWR